MISMLKELIVSIADLRYASVTCAHCKTKVTVDLSYLPQPQPGKIPEEILPLSQCPTCRAMFDSRIPENIGNLRKTYQNLVANGVLVSFQVQCEVS
jgi:hypothetical protein